MQNYKPQITNHKQYQNTNKPTLSIAILNLFAICLLVLLATKEQWNAS